MLTGSTSHGRRYGMTVKAIAEHSGKSIPTIYYWQRSNLVMLDAVSRMARNTAWHPERRQNAAKAYEADGDFLLHFYPGPNVAPSHANFSPLMDFMFYLSGVELWLLGQGAQEAPVGDDQSSEDDDLIRSLVYLQEALAEDDDRPTVMALQSELMDSMSDCVARHGIGIEVVPEVAILRLILRITITIDGVRKQHAHATGLSSP